MCSHDYANTKSSFCFPAALHVKGFDSSNAHEKAFHNTRGHELELLLEFLVNILVTDVRRIQLAVERAPIPFQLQNLPRIVNSAVSNEAAVKLLDLFSLRHKTEFTRADEYENRAEDMFKELEEGIASEGKYT